MTTPHPHAHLMALYAQDAAETDTPWLRWEFRNSNHAPWEASCNHPGWITSHQYRRKPVRIPTRVVNGFEVPAPVTKPLELKSDYFIATPEAVAWYCYCEWSNDKEDWVWLERGMVFLHEDHAIANAKAMLGIDPRS